MNPNRTAPNTDAAKCREALPMIVQAENHTANAQTAAVFFFRHTTLTEIDVAIARLQLAREVLRG